MQNPDSSRRGRPEAALVVWTWRASGEPAGDPSGGLRRTGVLRGLFALAVATVFFFVAHLVVAVIVATIGAITLITALVSPRRGYGAIHRFGERLGVWVGRAIGFVLLPLLFFLVITPLALLFRLQGRDVLKRAREADATTFWTRRDDEDRDDTYYRRQF